MLPSHFTGPSVYESEFHRERTIRFPIGLPAHCVGVNVSKLGQAPLDAQHATCPLFCGHEIGKSLVHNVADTLEMAIVDIVESSTSHKLQKNPMTSTERKTDKAVVSSTALIENPNHPLSEQTTAKNKPDENIQDELEHVEKINSDVNKIPIQVEEPSEIRESVVGLADIPKIKSNKAKEASTDSKKQELDPLLLSVVDNVNSTKLLENDIKSTFIKKTELNRFDIPKSTNANVDPSTSDTIASSSTATAIAAVAAAAAAAAEIAAATTTMATTTKHGIAIEPTKSSCALIYVVLRSESFNVTLGSDEICHNFNITYNIPLSKYMKEDRFDLIFM